MDNQDPLDQIYGYHTSFLLKDENKNTFHCHFYTTQSHKQSEYMIPRWHISSCSYAVVLMYYPQKHDPAFGGQ